MLCLILGPIVLGLVAGVIAPKILSMPCRIVVIDRQPSPDQTHEAVLYRRICKENDDFLIHLSILSMQSNLPEGRGNILVADGKQINESAPKDAFAMLWSDNDHVMITYPKEMGIYFKEDRYGSIHIGYQPIE